MKNRIQKFNLEEEYKKSWDYLKGSRNFIYISVGLFLVFVLVGFFLPAPEILSEQIKTLIEDLIEKTRGMDQLELITFIFFNNLEVSFFGMILGVLFGIIPLIFLIGNGYVLGFVSSLVVEEGSPVILLRLLPHGIFELPAIFISLALGLKFGTFIFQKDRSNSFKNYFWNSIRIFIFVVLPLLIVAAIIEGSLIVLGS